MHITEIRIKLAGGDRSKQRLRAFCTVTFDNMLIVRDLKILEGERGYFVAMPNRKATFRCPQCNTKNASGSHYCNNCGLEISRYDPNIRALAETPSKMYVDVVHPVNSNGREFIHATILQAYDEERRRALLPGYIPSYDDFVDD